MAGRQGAEKFRVDKHPFGRMKEANLVFHHAHVYCRFPSNGSIALSYQRGWNINIWDPPFKSCGNEPAQVGHHSPAQVDQETLPAGPKNQQFVPEPFSGQQSLRILSFLNFK